MARVKTRSSTQGYIQDVVKGEISKYLMSSDFKDILRESFKDVLTSMLTQVVQPLEERIVKLEGQVLELQEKCNENEQYSRRSNVRIYGVSPTLLESEESPGMKKIVLKR